MKNLDHKHFTNKATTTMNGNKLQDAAIQQRQKKEKYLNIISNDEYFLNISNEFKLISNVDVLHIAYSYCQNQNYSDEKINMKTKNAKYLIMDNGNILWIDWICFFNHCILQVFNKCSYNENETKTIHLYESTKLTNDPTQQSQYGALCTKRDVAVVPSNYFKLVIKPSDYESLLHILIGCTNITVQNAKKQESLAFEMRHKLLEVHNIVCLGKQKKMFHKLSQFSNFLSFLRFFASEPKERRDYEDKNALSVISQNWYIQDIFQGYIINTLQKKIKTNTLYYIAQHYFVLIVNFSPNLIIEVNKKFDNVIFMIFNNNFYQEISDWYTVGQSICIHATKNLSNFFVKILQQENKTKALTFTDSYQNDLDFCSQINCHSDQKQDENIVDNVQIKEYVSTQTAEFEKLLNEKYINAYDFVEPAYNISEVIIEEPTDCMSIKTSVSYVDVNKINSVEIEEIDEVFYEATNADNDEHIYEIDELYEQSLYSIETDQPVDEKLSICDIELTMITENYTDNCKFSDSESLKTKLSKSFISLQKVKGKPWLHDVQSSEIGETNNTVSSHNSDGDKIINNVFENNHKMYNNYFLHSKHWLTKLFKKTQVSSEIDYQKELVDYQQSKDITSAEIYRTCVQKDLFQLYQPYCLQTATDLYRKNYVALYSYYEEFSKYLGKTLLNIFCSTNI